MFKKHDFSSNYFKKGDMTGNFKRLGSFHQHGQVHAMMRADDFDLKGVRKAGNALEKKH